MIGRRAFLAALAPNPDADLLLHSGKVVIDEWRAGSGASIRPGSLWKPFLASAVESAGAIVCTGADCWRRHGRVQVIEAIGYSCNAWFDACSFNPHRLQAFGLRAQDGHWSRWSTTPNELLAAFRELLAREVHHPEVLAGMRLAAERGTAAALGNGFVAKTGTGPSQRHAGDGWVLAAWRENAALYRVPGVPGSQAARFLKDHLRSRGRL